MAHAYKKTNTRKNCFMLYNVFYVVLLLRGSMAHAYKKTNTRKNCFMLYNVFYVVFYVINLYKTSARSESFESKNNSI